MRRTPLAVALTALATTAAVAATRSAGFFLGAGAGCGVPFEPVALPEPALPPQSLDLPLLKTFTVRSPFTPTLHQLLEGETLVTTDRQMREIWRRLFREPYDAAQFDFESSFVVFMGGGTIANGSFDISAVEQVEASYADPGGFDGRATEAFLSVTATTFLSGVQPLEPPPASWRVSAVKVSRALRDHVVFRRNVVLGI